MNLLEILNENSILLEAVRINNSRDAYELIKNKKLGVKIHPSYNINEIENTKEEFMQILDKIITKSGANDKVFAVQFFMNKVPMNQMLTFADRSYIFKAISYRNKPWAKDYPGYKEFISLDGKDVVYKDLNKLVEDLEIEAQRHGHGDKKEVKNLYNDGTWTLQVPTSFKGAKSISFYGRKGEKQIPTEWCTRADIFWYNKYAKDSPLYVIRNWESGKSYQIAFDNNNVHFLDQNDVKGDGIAKGDLSSIPDELLELIKWNGKTLKDFKDIDKQTRGSKVVKGASFRDSTNSLVKARWGNDIKLRDNIIKNVWENFNEKEGSKDKLVDYMINNKVSGYTKHDGDWAAKYYFEKNPDYFIIMKRANWTKGRFVDEYYFDRESEIEAIDKSDFREAIGGSKEELLLKVAQDDIGETKRKKRAENKKSDNLELANSLKKDVKTALNKHILSSLSNILKNHLRDNNINVEIRNIYVDKNSGSFIPRKLLIDINLQNAIIGILNIYREEDNKNKIKYHATCSWIYGDYYSGAESNHSLEKEIEQEINKIIIRYSKEMVKNKAGIKLRNNARATNLKNSKKHNSNPYRKTYFEDYFPY